ncbi:uncharacterized protein LOC135372280 isoform X2 [Ornithodoros turicata]|uniref:uncharacterized protein LOC135372280 isoform X2 n=1 Tax=Ornithodoros turicata TaxID=34597 RepID=UPI00313930F3
MYALVRYLNQFDSTLHVINADNIVNFNPKDDDDFDNKATYDAWKPGTSDVCPVQILLLARTEAELERKKTSKRVFVPKLNTSQCESAAAPISQKQKIRQILGRRASTHRVKIIHSLQEEKKKRQKQTTSTRKEYENIIDKHLQNATKEAAQAHGVRRKRHRDTDDFSESEVSDSECIVSAAEVKKANEEATYWQRLCEKNLWELKTKLGRIEKIVEEVLVTVQAAGFDEKLFGRQSSTPVHEPPQEIPGPVASPSTTEPLSVTPCSLTSDPSSTDLEPFTKIDDKHFHLKDGVVVSHVLADKLKKIKKPTVVIRETAQAIWGTEKLKERSYGGRLAPKDKRDNSKQPRKELTPHKVGVVVATLNHWRDSNSMADPTWEQRNGAAVDTALLNISTILSSKIQAARRPPKMTLQL